MGCCRGRRPARKDRQPSDCKKLEDGGARTAVQIKLTDRGPRLVVATTSNGFMDVGSFLGAYKCQGAMARLLSRYLPLIQQALALDPGAFATHRSGIHITDLIRVAEKVTKGARSNVQQTPVSPVPPG